MHVGIPCHSFLNKVFQPCFCGTRGAGSALIAKEDRNTIGVCVWSPVLRRISLLAVIPAARGKGIASALLDEALRRMPPGDVFVETFREDDIRGTAALAFYRKYGFQKAGLLDGFTVPMAKITAVPE